MHALTGLASPWVYVVVGVLAALEASAFVDLFVPGELALLAGGYVVQQGHARLDVMMAVAVIAAIIAAARRGSPRSPWPGLLDEAGEGGARPGMPFVTTGYGATSRGCRRRPAEGGPTKWQDSRSSPRRAST